MEQELEGSVMRILGSEAFRQALLAQQQVEPREGATERIMAPSGSPPPPDTEVLAGLDEPDNGDWCRLVTEELGLQQSPSTTADDSSKDADHTSIADHRDGDPGA